ncbi:hypothetical protein Tco_0470095, partial [Tanacetum coccineum]
PVDITAAATTFTGAAATTKLATDVNPDLAGPSHPKESKGSDDFFYSLKIIVTQKDRDISLLNSRATSLASTLDDAKVTCVEAGHKITSLASERDRLAFEVSSLHA